MVIQHNLTAFNSNRQLGIMNGVKAKTAEKLASGYKINRAADDAAGLAISEKMRRQIRGLSQATENVQDGVSYVQVADGALAQIDEMLARMTQLCVQAATNTLTNEDRAEINKEIQQIKMECTRIFHVTSFNERPIWDENNQTKIPVGTERRPIYTSSLGTTGTVTETNRGAWPSNQYFNYSTTANGVKVSWTGYDGINYESKEIPWPSEEDLKKGFTIKLDDTTMDYSGTNAAARGIEMGFTFTLDEDATLDMLVKDLNGKRAFAGTSYTVSGSAKGSGETYSITGSMNYLSGLVYRDSITGSEDRMDPSGSANNREQSNTASALSFLFNFGKSDETQPASPSTFPVTVSYSGSVSTSCGTRNDNTKGLWWDSNRYGTYSMGQGASNSSLEQAVKSALGAHTNPYNHNSVELNDYGGTLTISLGITSGEALKYGDTGVELSTNQRAMGNLTLTMSVAKDETTDHVLQRIKNITGADLTRSSFNGISRSNISVGYFDANVYGGAMGLNIQAGADNTQSDIIPIIYDVLSVYYLGIDNLNTLTDSEARKGLELISNAAQIVDGQRAVFGAYQNRMEHTIRNLENVVENTTSAESQIRDADMAAELVRFSNSNILSHAGDAMLAQANQTNQGVLALLK
ncbi:flagellin N-terminal helical domain-containing protein [Butyrivibrio sp. YAB3001]|uniref:flagellin N-terminal helical domain-containing protein n=1 Tax=Butyrivibrio sp. YAB3001 TaxID=1520812 RepID=UPI0008F6767E|nr:flagellin [Butyrivibrio sp. YAB3001]SFC11314.1 flagellin [Butyrivibrio sp. YAB3001]